MAERSFKQEVGKLRLGEGDEFRGEAILAVTKALLQSGVAYVAGYQGAPVSHLMDVLADSAELLTELGVHFDSSASEATAAATLAASVNYPLRGAVTFKATVGTNVASDALANLASGGVLGGALIIVGEDYGEGSSIMQERSHAFAMKSQIWLLDPRPQLPAIVRAVERGFELSEASHTPVMLQLRIRACHVYGRFTTRANRAPAFTLADAARAPVRDVSRVVLPPASFAHEKQKLEERWPAAVRFIREHGLNEVFGPPDAELGIVLQGGLYNTVLRALELLGHADAFGRSDIALYVLNVTYPIVDDEVIEFCAKRRAVLLVEEGQPDFIEQNLNTILRRAGVGVALHGKDMLPRAGEYTGEQVMAGVRKFLERHAGRAPLVEARRTIPIRASAADVLPRPPGLCTGCPERPIFAAMKLLQREIGPVHVTGDIGCHTFGSLPPFDIGSSTMGYGLGWASAGAFNGLRGGQTGGERRTLSLMGDGGFWHNGLTSGVGNAVFNRGDGVLVVIDNNYSAATGGQDILSSRTTDPRRDTGHAIEDAVRGVGVRWVRRITRTYDLARMLDVLREALTTPERGPKVVIAQSECMLNKQRREKPQVAKAIAAHERTLQERYGVDADTCTGDHSCIRLSGCPSLTVKDNPDPLRRDPVAHVIDSCVGCGHCGEVAHAAVLCPSFYRVQTVHHPRRIERWRAGVAQRVIGWLQSRTARRLTAELNALAR